MLPLSLLKTAVNHPMLVELKNGETYNGHLVNCDNWMNCDRNTTLAKPFLKAKQKDIAISYCCQLLHKW